MEIGIAADNTIPLHFPSFLEFMRTHAKKLNCHAVNLPLRFTGELLDYEAEIAGITSEMRTELRKNDLSLLVTSIPFENNLFYRGHEGIFIFSLSDWNLLTTLPMSNGLAYMLCQIILKSQLYIGQDHDENTGCIRDFLWDKRGIDVAMRAAFLCDKCRSYSADNPHLASQEFADIVLVLNAISAASRRGADIMFEPAIGPEVFLSYNSEDKAAVLLLNKALRNGGIKTWLDEEQIKPGEVWQITLEAEISSIGACLVIVGDSGLGPWQHFEQLAFINEFARRGCKVIPVFIGNSTKPPQLPVFLRQFMWSDLKNDDGHQLAKLISALRS